MWTRDGDVTTRVVYPNWMSTQQDKGNNGNKAKSMVESPSKGHKRRHGAGGGTGGGTGGSSAGEVSGPDREQTGNGNEDERGPPRQKKKKNDANSEVA